jgi:hypothetical protein
MIRIDSFDIANPAELQSLRGEQISPRYLTTNSSPFGERARMPASSQLPLTGLGGAPDGSSATRGVLTAGGGSSGAGALRAQESAPKMSAQMPSRRRTVISLYDSQREEYHASRRAAR